jgi:hypothetical protein
MSYARFLNPVRRRVSRQAARIHKLFNICSAQSLSKLQRQYRRQFWNSSESDIDGSKHDLLQKSVPCHICTKFQCIHRQMIFMVCPNSHLTCSTQLLHVESSKKNGRRHLRYLEIATKDPVLWMYDLPRETCCAGTPRRMAAAAPGAKQLTPWDWLFDYFFEIFKEWFPESVLPESFKCNIQKYVFKSSIQYIHIIIRHAYLYMHIYILTYIQ